MAVKEREGLYEINPGNCIGCGHCGAICPVGAVKADGIELLPYLPPELSEESAFHLMAGKRSVRRYKTDPIPRDLLDRMLDVGSLTSTATNSMNVRATLFTGEDVTRLTYLLCAILLKGVNLLDNPLGRAAAKLAGFKRYASPKVLAAFRKQLIAGKEGTGDPLFFKAPAVLCLTYPKKDKSFGRTNAVLAGQSMMLYAHSQGVESCMIGFAEMAAKFGKGRKGLNVPDDRRVGLIFTLGYGEPAYRRLPKRVPLI